MDTGQMRGGLTFLKTKHRAEMVEFYRSKLKRTVWMEQPNITIGWHQITDVDDDNELDLDGM
jgi:hypothetical protein